MDETRWHLVRMEEPEPKTGRDWGKHAGLIGPLRPDQVKGTDQRKEQGTSITKRGGNTKPGKDPSRGGQWRKTMVLRPRWVWNKAEAYRQSQSWRRPWSQARDCVLPKERCGLTKDFSLRCPFILYISHPDRETEHDQEHRSPPPRPLKKT